MSIVTKEDLVIEIIELRGRLSRAAEHLKDLDSALDSLSRENEDLDMRDINKLINKVGEELE